MPIGETPGDGPTYLDHNATTPMDTGALEAMLPYFRSQFGNPSSSHDFGRIAAAAVNRARRQTSSLIGADRQDIVFTGSGSEANALAIRGALLPALRAGRNHVVTQVTEHPSVIENCEALKRLHGIWVTYLPVDEYGQIAPEILREAMTEQTALVSIQCANGETGTIHPVDQLAAIAHEYGALMHTDAAQAVGKVSVDVGDMGVDLLSLAGHKFYGPKGIGALHLPKHLHFEPVVHGGGQERGQRAGTENVPAIVGLGAASEKAAEVLDSEYVRLTKLRDRLYEALVALLPDRITLNGHPAHRLPNTLNVSIDGVVGTEVLASTPTIAASTASACHSGSVRPSEVLLAMGMDEERALGALRLSLGRSTYERHVDRAAEAIAEAVRVRDSATSSRRKTAAVGAGTEPGRGTSDAEHE